MSSTRAKAVKLAQKKAKVSSSALGQKQVQVLQQVKRRGRDGNKKQKRRKGSRGPRTSRVSKTLTPARSVVWLKYVSTQTLGLANHSFGYPIYTNGAFAVDPSSPSGFTTTPGFSVRAAQYAAYRVRRYKGSVTFENTTATPAETVVCHTNSNLGTSNGGSGTIDLLQFAANRPQINTIRPIQSSAGGPNKAVHRFRHTIASIAGESIMQPGYKSLTNTVPTNLTYLVFGWVGTSNVTSMSVSVELMMEVEFLDYIDTLTSFASEKDRLLALGKPEVSMCAGCKAVQQIEFAPCPDPKCVCEDSCTNCGFSRRCSANCQSPRCPYKLETIVLRSPMVKTDSRSRIQQ